MKRLVQQSAKAILGSLGYQRLRLRLKPQLSESDVIMLCALQLQKPGATMIDVGAHFGESLKPFVELGWKVVAFEPDPDPRKQEVLSKIDSNNVAIEFIALGSEEGELPLYASPESTGITSLVPFHSTHEPVGAVPVSTLAKVIENHSLTHIEFLKIDCEGYDFEVLQGFPWQGDRELFPKLIVAEFEDAKTAERGWRWRDLAEFLAAKGYQVLISEWFPIERYGIAHRWRELKSYPCELTDLNGWGNVIALQNAPPNQVEALISNS